jgi:hypothetical protein
MDMKKFKGIEIDENKVRIEETTTRIDIFDKNNNRIYSEFVDVNYWTKNEFDKNNNCIYYENSDGEWVRYEYDENNNEIYYENVYGLIIDNCTLIG